ncbi:MAG TPA: hypothetical protein PLW31_09165 [Bacteroidales bacterium]|nr:hypothetical protein [Bacteroidales bacterium]HOX78199.1 hypothetical protein [Bacteroidales bacterium]HPI86962.1 hypothetical protein [Bacteroidales bacterium]HPM93196.1 hypothetical protein [Bacteroidales bacterium]
MKNRIFTSMTFMVAALISLAFITGGCKSKKETTAVQAPAPGEVEVSVYCSGPEYRSDNDYFRANSIGESADQATSQKKALSNAKANLAGFIETTLKATFDNYVKDSEMNNVSETLEKYEGLSREVVNQKLNGIKVICEKQTRTTTNTYKTYVAIELAGDEIASAMNQRLSTDDKLFIDYNYEKFKETFDKEMENMK